MKALKYLITRLYTAACDVKFPSPEVNTFRHVLQFRLAIALNLKAYKSKPTACPDPAMTAAEKDIHDAERLRLKVADAEVVLGNLKAKLARLEARISGGPAPENDLDILWKTALPTARTRSSKIQCRQEWNRIPKHERPTVRPKPSPSTCSSAPSPTRRARVITRTPPPAKTTRFPPPNCARPGPSW